MDDPTPHLERFSSYDQAIREFQWHIPQRVNIAAAICRRHPDSITRIALSDIRKGGANTYTFGGLDYFSDKFATALLECDIKPGDAVSIALPPSAELAIALLGSIKAGAVAVPLSPSTRTDFAAHVLQVTRAKVIILNESQLAELPLENVAPKETETCFIVGDLPTTQVMSCTYKSFWSVVDRCSSDFRAIEPESDSPVLVCFVETKEKSYGVVHSARSVMSQLSGFEFFNDFGGNAVFWAGDDWSSPTVLLGTLYPAWWYGCSMIADSSDREVAITHLVDQFEITNIYSEAQWQGELPKMTSSLNEVFGTPETGWLIGNSNKWVEPGAPSVSRVVPGRLVQVIDSNGNSLPAGAVGQIAIHKSDPGLFTEYYGEGKNVSIGEWFLIGESGFKTEAGELRFARQGLKL